MRNPATQYIPRSQRRIIARRAATRPRRRAQYSSQVCGRYRKPFRIAIWLPRTLPTLLILLGISAGWMMLQAALMSRGGIH